MSRHIGLASKDKILLKIIYDNTGDGVGDVVFSAYKYDNL